MADISVTAASVALASGPQVTGTAGETITAGMALYLKASDNRLWKAQADGSVAEADCVGVSLHGATAGQPLAYAGNGALMNIGGTTVTGVFYYVSAAAGGIGIVSELVSTNKVSIVGYATGTSGSVFNVRTVATGSAL